VPVHGLPDFIPPFLLPSRYCQLDRLAELAQTIIEGDERACDQVEAVRGWIHASNAGIDASIDGCYGMSNAPTSAPDALHG
jgi:hypothetical protein